jgi:hypothetical protein
MRAHYRLGARHGFDLLARYISWTWKDPGKPDEDDDEDATGFDEETRQDGNRRRGALLERLAANGLIASSSNAGALWARWWMTGDSSKRAASTSGDRGPCRRSMKRRSAGISTPAKSSRSRIADGAGHPSREAEPAEDAGIHLGVIAGDTAGLAKLAHRIRAAAGEPIRFRLEANSFRDDLADALRAVGFQAWQWELHILGRPGPSSAPPLDPARLILGEKPKAVIRAPT